MWTILLVGVLLAGFCAPVVGRVSAQSAEGLTLINISGSGSASEPVIWPGPGREFQAFWWDLFDGVTTAVYRDGRWSEPVAATLEYPMPSTTAESEMVETKEMASIVAGPDGWAHAAWLGPMDEDTELVPLFHSAMPFGEHTWAEAHKITEGASVYKLALAPGNMLHVIYFQAIQLGDSPPGVYHRRSLDGGLSWAEPTMLAESLHYRRTTQATSHLEIVTDSIGYVLVSWNDPSTGESLWARSADAGQTWRQATPVSDDIVGAKDSRVLLGYGGQTMFLWTTLQSAVGAGVYQSTSTNGGYTRSTAERLFSHLRLDTHGMGYAWSGNKDLLLFAGSSAPTPLLLGWTPQGGWAVPKHIQVNANQTREVAGIRIDAWHAARSGGTVAMVGGSQDQEVWGIISSVDLLQQTAQAIPSVWSQPLEAVRPGILDWGEPVNLSRSGAASSAQLVSAQGGMFQVFWMDQFDGMVSSLYDGEQWYVSRPAPILARQVSARTDTGEPTTALLPLDLMPQIVGDGGQRAHAFWLAPPTSGEDTQRLLMHAVLNIGDVAWGDPQQIDDAALAWHIFDDGQGGLHLVYVRAFHTTEKPAGIYHTRSLDDGQWAAASLIEPSIYARIFEPDDVILDGAADGAGHVFVSWNDSRDADASYVLSSDGGQSWSVPLQVGVTESTVPRVAARGAGQFSTFLSLAGSDDVSSLYQQYSDDGGASWTQPERVFADGRVSLDALSFFSTNEGALLAVTGLGGSSLGLMAWDAKRSQQPSATGWSALRTTGFTIENSESGRAIPLGQLWLAASDETLVVLGQSSDSDLWVQMRAISGLEWAFADLPPWTEPVSLGTNTPASLSLTSDADGNLHALWDILDENGGSGGGLWYARSSNGLWSSAREVLAAPLGYARQPKLVAIGEKLHAAWNGGQFGEIYYSQAFARDAQTSSSWSDVVPLPLVADARGAAELDLKAGLDGSLHLVYTVPWNERRGVYYQSSIDGGQNWSEPRLVFDAQEADWPSVASPRLVVDLDGRLIVAFGRVNLPISIGSEGIYTTISIDQGQTWREPESVTENLAGSLHFALAERGQAHLVWRNLESGRGWKHSWTDDGGHNWSNPADVSAAISYAGEPALCSDLQGTLYLVGLARDRAQAPVLRTMTWVAASERWQAPEDLLLSLVPVPGTAVWAGLRPGTKRLDAVFLAAELAVNDGQQRVELYYMARALDGSGIAPVSMVTPEPTLTPTAGPSPTPTMAPKPTVNAQAPRLDTPVIELGPISLPVLSLVGMGAVGLIVAVILAVRLVRRRHRYGSYYYYHR